MHQNAIPSHVVLSLDGLIYGIDCYGSTLMNKANEMNTERAINLSGIHNSRLFIPYSVAK